MKDAYVVPTEDGKWAVLTKQYQYLRWERFWQWYWPCCGRWLNVLPGMWRER